MNLRREGLWRCFLPAYLPELPLAGRRGTVRHNVRQSLRRWRGESIALALAVLGIYRRMSYSVSDRLHEIAIRFSVGASRAQGILLIVLDGMKLAVFGLAIGVAGALATTRLLQSVLFDIQPNDPFTFAAVTMFLFVVAGTHRRSPLFGLQA